MIRKSRIYLGPIEISGYYSRLNSGFRRMGFPSRFLPLTEHPFNYQIDFQSDMLLRCLYYLQRTKSKWNGLIVRYFYNFIQKCILYLNMFRCIISFDVFVFGFGRSLLPGNTDLPFLKFIGKKIIMNCSHGSEMRPPYMSGASLNSDGSPTELIAIYNSTKRIYKQVQIIERYADTIIGAPFSSSQFGKRKMINHFCLGLPVPDIEGLALVENDGCDGISDDASVIIIHAPSNSQRKGTSKIRFAINNLISRGYKINYVELVGKTNDEVLRNLHVCDFVVDQLYSDTPMASLAAEAALFGKATIVGGYGLNQLREWVCKEMWPPTFLTDPENIESAIEYLINNKAEREKLGADAREFIKTKWTAGLIAQKMVRIIQGDIPPEWWFDPTEVVYPFGGAISVESLKGLINGYITCYGVEALKLDSRSDIIDALVANAILRVDK